MSGESRPGERGRRGQNVLLRCPPLSLNSVAHGSHPSHVSLLGTGNDSERAHAFHLVKEQRWLDHHRIIVHIAHNKRRLGHLPRCLTPYNVSSSAARYCLVSYRSPRPLLLRHLSCLSIPPMHPFCLSNFFPDENQNFLIVFTL